MENVERRYGRLRGDMADCHANEAKDDDVRSVCATGVRPSERLSGGKIVTGISMQEGGDPTQQHGEPALRDRVAGQVGLSQRNPNSFAP